MVPQRRFKIFKTVLVMIISYNWLNSFFKDKILKPEELADKLTLQAFETEAPFKEGDDFVMEVDVTPDRAGDALCHYGIARECSYFLNNKFEEPNINIKEDVKNKIDNYLSVVVKDKELCPRYTARVLTGIEIQDSPEWIKQRLKICGISPINNVVDVTNYVMLELGQPLHAFDYEKLSEDKKIVVEVSKEDRKVTLLGGNKIEVFKDTLLIKDKKEPLAIAGIKGGQGAEITAKTKAIVLESANFNHSLISRTARKIKLKTDSSFRFEHEMDTELTLKAIDRAASMLQELYGAKVLKGVIDIYEDKFKKPRIKLDLNYVNRLLGLEIKKAEVKKILKKIDFDIIKENHDFLFVEPPTYRRDVTIQESVIEEIGRIYGYNKIEAKEYIGGIPFHRNFNIFWQNEFKKNLKELGFTEVYNYSFISGKEKEVFNLDKLIEIENPLNVNSEYLKNSLIPLLANNVKDNLKFYKDINIYEIGKVFKKNKEELKLSGASSKQGYLYVKGVLEEVLNDVLITDIEYVPNRANNHFWHKGKSAVIKINQKEVGVIGHLSSYVLDKLELKIDPVFFELDFELIQKYCSERSEYRPISSHPAAIRDLSVVIPLDELSGSVLEEIYDTDMILIRDVELFDIYENSNKKSLSFHIVFQAQDRVLSNEELNDLQNKIISNLEKHPGWEVKK
jgi:phenylalanyl-tRNA synthetase beta chain